MFTGIVEAQGMVTRCARRARGRQLSVRIPPRWGRLRRGASLAINGVCLSAVSVRISGLTFDVVPETLRRTNVATLRPGDRVNVERAMRANQRFDGHLVSGHVDGTARVRDRSRQGRDAWIDVSLPRALARYVVPKGSITLDGVSLTVGRLRGQCLRIYLIPTTLTRTTLGRCQVGDRLNVEADLLVKLADRLMQFR